MSRGLHVYGPLFLPDVHETWIFDRFSKSPQISASLQSLQWEPSCSMWTDGQTDKVTGGRTDRRTDMTKLIVAFRNFANKSKNCCIYMLLLRNDSYPAATHRYIQPFSRRIILSSHFVTVLYVTLPSSSHTSRNILKVSALVLFNLTINRMFNSCSAFVINHHHGKWNKNYINLLLDTTWTWQRLVWLAGGERFRGNWYVFTTAVVSFSRLRRSIVL
jgi:hypothetical protein